MKKIINIYLVVVMLFPIFFSCTKKDQAIEQNNYELCGSVKETGYWADTLLQKRDYQGAKKGYLQYLDSVKDVSLTSVKVQRNLANCFDGLGMYDTAYVLYKQSLNGFESLGYAFGVAKTYSNLCGISCSMSELSQAVDYGMKGMEVLDNYSMHADELSDDFYDMKANVLANIGFAYLYQSNPSMALKYYKEALSLFEKINNTNRMIMLYHNIGNVLNKPEEPSLYDPKKALQYYKEELKIAEEQGDYLSVAYAYHGISKAFNQEVFGHEYSDSSKFFLDKSLNTLTTYFQCDFQSSEVTVDLFLYTSVLVSNAMYYDEHKKYDESLFFAKKALAIANYTEETYSLRDVYSILSRVYYNLNVLDKAYQYQLLYSDLIEKVNNSEIADAFARHETEKREAENQILQAENNVQQAQLKQKNTLMWAIIIGSLLGAISVTVFVLYRARQSRRLKAEKEKTDQLNAKLEQKNAEITAQRDDIAAKGEVIAQKNQDISDSINYAQRIQTAMLPNLEGKLVFNKPKDVISGDFYWKKSFDTENGHVLYVAAVDCTGHGVPGALLSMLGLSFLNEIVKTPEIGPNIVLDQLREKVITSLKQGGGSSSTDGMDMALIRIDYANQKISCAGANNPVVRIRKGELKVIKLDKMPISIHRKMDNFQEIEMPIEEGDMYYLFSDGFSDQFGGGKGRKYGNKNRFEKLLQSISRHSLSTQNELLEKELLEWRGEEAQIDDIIIVGVKI